jgi:CTP:molybdopterin cytidylyltransferase MocA
MTAGFSIAAVVLAAGHGRRFGGAKLAAELAGRPLLEHALAPLRTTSRFDRIIVVVDAAAATPGVESDGIEFAPCPDSIDGISASLRTGIEAAEKADADAALITLGDQPLLTAAVVEAVLDCGDSHLPAARAVYHGRPGHPVLIKRVLYSQVKKLRGDQGARQLLERAGVAEVECADRSSDLDVDTVADLDRARRELGR